MIATVRASDADEGPNADVKYSLIGGNDDRLFDVDRKRGDVTLSRNLRGDIDDQVKPISSNTCTLKYRLPSTRCSLRASQSGDFISI